MKTRVLQVKRFHEEIAQPKEQEAIQRWRDQDNGYGYPVESMFYFMGTDSKGYPTTKRQKGYVAYTDKRTFYGRNKQEAIDKMAHYLNKI